MVKHFQRAALWDASLCNNHNKITANYFDKFDWNNQSVKEKMSDICWVQRLESKDFFAIKFSFV